MNYTPEGFTLLFEGAEKKAHIYLDGHSCCLHTDVAQNFWHNLVAQAGAKVLSVTRHSDCHAYLLSESSLFVWRDHFVIMTCGVTQLVNAVEFFINSSLGKFISRVEYQRKNEYFSTQQPSSFVQDIERLQQYTNGKTTLFGDLDNHYNRLFQADLNNKNHVVATDNFEILAYQINQQSSDFFTSNGLTTRDIIDYLSLGNFLADFSIDDHFFEPVGYSLNAICATQYLTIHITPQHQHSYLSIVGNVNTTALIKSLVERLAPLALDVFTMTDATISTHQVSDYQCINQQHTCLNEQHITYANFKLDQ